MILSDKTIRAELEAGGIVIEPLGDDAIQPSSVDLHVDRFFRVFRNDTTPFIDPKEPQDDLTEFVEVEEDKAFILHPGEFVLGSTCERVALSDDLVARLEGKSSLGRLGLLIHSSLPASEPVMLLHGGRLEPRPIGEIVRERLQGSVVSFDPETFKVDYHEITGWFEGPPDRIYEVRLASGRRIRITAGHNLFTLDQDGRLAKTRTLELQPGTRVAVPAALPCGDMSQKVSDDRRLQLPTGTSRQRLDEETQGTGIATLKTLLSEAYQVDHGSSIQKHGQRTGDLLWEPVVEVRDTGSVESIFDLEVRPGGRKIENFLAGLGGVFAKNTAGFVDAGWDGHLTLELSNVANLPIAIYPGMKIGQISFLRMSTPAEHPYGSDATKSKYQGQRGPTPSRYYLNFRDDE